MKKNILQIISMVVLLISAQSCSDSLEETNPNSVSTDVYWSTLTESNDNLTSVYGAMLNHFIWFFDVDAFTSDMAFPSDRRNPRGSYTPFYQQRFSNTNKELTQRWDALYQVVFRSNQVIDGLNGMNDDLKSQPGWTEQMAQARYFRGLAHFYLHSTYNEGKIIIRDFIPASSEEFSLATSSSDDVIAFFREDLEYAYDNLPASWEQKTRVSAGNAAFNLGKSYLYNKEYDKAIPFLKDVIENSEYGYRLLDGEDINLLFTEAGDYNDESIFELNYSDKQQTEESQWDEESFNNRWGRYFGPQSGLKIGGGNSWVIPSAWLTNEYLQEPLDIDDARNYVDNGSGGLALRSVSLRCSQLVAVVNDEDTEYYLQPKANSFYGFGNTKFSNFKKYSNHDKSVSENEVLGINWKSGKNVIVDRIADAYLMLAECILQDSGDVSAALNYINPIRKRWGVVQLEAADYDATTLMEHIMYKERPLELAVEGYSTRNIDLRRWGITKTRLEELAAQDWNLVEYVSPDGTKFPKSLIQEGLSPDPSDNTITIKEYVDAANNYQDNLHAYWELPLSEVLNNQQSSN
ncbi:RagB/SusD family nutrient uptake outer membrane protein [uncultured Maribacter sp.]|uniref:RagB/SusD family nutrient uptake outer membrane protein n=1 Tax=uncultured Maribacter sp. TaxID=431308 RepID=UPI0026278C9F|nr:RagB/SusD family nutrient uptake outer membrane protein [uncultured Maribacter sp.]